MLCMRTQKMRTKSHNAYYVKSILGFMHSARGRNSALYSFVGIMLPLYLCAIMQIA